VIDPIQVGIYFIALRMKRETMDENRGVLDAVLETHPPRHGGGRRSGRHRRSL